LIPAVLLLAYLLSTVWGGLLLALVAVALLMTSYGPSKFHPSDDGAWKG